MTADRPPGPDVRRAPATTPAPSRCMVETSTTDTSDTYRTEPTRNDSAERGTNLVWRVRWRRSTWSRSTASKSRMFGDPRPAATLADRLRAEGYFVSVTWARAGLWHPVDVSWPTQPIERPGACQACGGSRQFLPEIPDLARSCPACLKVAS